MKKIANIVSQNNVDVSEIINVVKTMDEIEHGLPTLIVDFDYVNQKYPDFDITESYLGDNLWWTFKKTQKRDKHVEDLENFINTVYTNLFKNIPYFFVDLIHNSNKTLVRVIRKFHLMKGIYTYEHGEMLYIYGDNIIFGVDLRLASYIGIDSLKLKNKIKVKSLVFLGVDEILIEYKTILRENETHVRYLPYLISIIHEQNNIAGSIHIPREGNVVS
jgi:hypothetical protein